MPPIEIGVENITKITNIVVDIANQSVQVFADGVQGLDFLQFIDEGAALGAASSSWKQLAPEVKNLSPAETETIIKNIETRLQIPNALAKTIVVESLGLIAGGSRLYFAVKAARDAKKGV